MLEKSKFFKQFLVSCTKNHEYLIWKFINLVNVLFHAPPSHPHRHSYDTRHAHNSISQSPTHKIIRTHKKFLQKFPVTFFLCPSVWFCVWHKTLTCCVALGRNSEKIILKIPNEMRKMYWKWNFHVARFYIESDVQCTPALTLPKPAKCNSVRVFVFVQFEWLKVEQEYFSFHFMYRFFFLSFLFLFFLLVRDRISPNSTHTHVASEKLTFVVFGFDSFSPSHSHSASQSRRVQVKLMMQIAWKFQGSTGVMVLN